MRTIALCLALAATSAVAASPLLDGSQIKPLTACNDLTSERTIFVDSGQQLEKEQIQSDSNNTTPRFHCMWSNDEREPQCLTMLDLLPPDIELPDTRDCHEIANIWQWPTRNYPTREAALQDFPGTNEIPLRHPRETYTAIADPRLEEPEYHNILIFKNTENRNHDWEYFMVVVVPEDWWEPAPTVVLARRSMLLPSHAGNTPENADRVSPPVPADEAVVTAFLNMLEPAQCIVPTPGCIARAQEQGMRALGDSAKHLEAMQALLSEEALEEMQKAQEDLESILRQLEEQ